MVNSFGPGNQKIPAKQSHRPKKLDNPLANTLMGGTPAANPMGGAQMDFDMPDMSGMGGMQMNAPSPVAGNYEDFMMGMTAIDGKQPSGFQGKMNPGVMEGHTTAGGGIPGGLGMSSMGAQPTDMAGFSGADSLPYTTDPSTGPNIRYWDDPQPRVDPIVDPKRGFISTPTGSGLAGTDTPGGGQSPQVAGWDDPAMGGFQMDTPMMGYDYGPGMTEDAYNQFPGMTQEWYVGTNPDPYSEGSGAFGIDDPLSASSMGAVPLSPQADFPVAPVAPVAPPVSEAPPLPPIPDPPVPPPVPGPQPPPPGLPDPYPLPPPVPPPVAPAVSRPPVGEVSDEEPAASTEPVSEGAMMDERNWDTVDETGRHDPDGEYKFMGADYHKQNTRPETDTKDWEETREEAAEDIKEGDKFSEVGDAAYGSASSESRSAANEADLGRPDTREGFNEPRIFIDPREEGGTVGNWGGSSFAGTQPPPISLPPQTDSDYYNKLVNPDPFQNPIIPDLPKGYGSQRVEGGDEFHKFEGREYDVDPKEILTEEGYPVMPSQGIDSNAGGMSVLDTRRFGTTPAQVQALVNNEVANTYQQANQGLGAMTGARPGMSGDIGSYAQQSLGPEVAARMAAGQAQIDIPWQYAMQHADSVRQRRDLAHKLGMEEAGMITGDYYDYLNNLREYGNTDNQITQWAAQQMPDAFG